MKSEDLAETIQEYVDSAIDLAKAEMAVEMKRLVAEAKADVTAAKLKEWR